jgi:PAS domain S-box-containing protein
MRSVLRMEIAAASGVLVAGLVISATGAMAFDHSVEGDRQQQLNQRAQQAKNLVDQRINSYIEIVHGIRGTFAGSATVERSEFHAVVAADELSTRFQNPPTIVFFRAVPVEQFGSFESRVRQETGVSDVVVHPARASGTAVVADYMEPTLSPSFLGFDVTSDSVRNATIENARDSGDVIGTAPIPSVAQPGNGPGLGLYVAIYDTSEIPSTTAARRKHFVGIVSAYSRTGDMLTTVLGSHAHVDVEIYDVGSIVDNENLPLTSNNRVYDSNPKTSSTDSNERSVTDIDVGTRRWRAIVIPGAGFTVGVERFVPWGIAAGGLVVSVLLSAFIGSIGRSRRQAEALAHDMTVELREQSVDMARLASLVEATSDTIMRVDLSGEIVSWNPGAAATYGWPPEEIIGKHLSTLMPEERKSEVHRIIEEVAAGNAMNLEGVRVRKDGSTFEASSSWSPVVDEDGNVVALSCVSRDVTDRRKTEAALALAHHQLEKHAQELERSNAELEQFAYIASHDLQEPLRMVASFVDRIGSRYGERLDERGQRYVHYAVDGARRMQALIDALLEFSGVGRGEIKARVTDMQTLMDEVLLTLQNRISETGAEVIIDELPTVIVDPVLIRQLLQNLTSNALKFRHPDRNPVVHISAQRHGSDWRFFVDDNGIGIDPAHRAKVFEVFRRLHTVDEYPGTGIGLSICQRIVERHGGTISVDESPDGGARFVFTIPDMSPDTR